MSNELFSKFISFVDLMKVSHEGTSTSASEGKSAELVLLLDGLRIDPASLLQSRDLLGEASNSQTPLNEGVRARIRMRNNPEIMRPMLRAQALRVSFLDCDRDLFETSCALLLRMRCCYGNVKW